MFRELLFYGHSVEGNVVGDEIKCRCYNTTELKMSSPV